MKKRLASQRKHNAYSNIYVRLNGLMRISESSHASDQRTSELCMYVLNHPLWQHLARIVLLDLNVAWRIQYSLFYRKNVL